MLIGNLRAPTPSIEERFATEIGAGPLFLGDLRKLTPRERDWYSRKIRWFKDFRRRASIDDSFFPLGNWMQPNSASWDGFARLSRDAGGMVVLFKNQSAVASADVRLPAPPGALYHAKSIMTSQELGNVNATSLTRGWTVRFPAGHSIAMIELDR
jgi:hypothetical protein